MTGHEVVRLRVNFKTLEEFENFREYGQQELSMKEDLEENIVENDSESPFYGIYFGNKLVGRMSLYKISAKYDLYFDPPHDYLELWKLEVLPGYQGKGIGKAMVDFAKSFKLPVKTNARQRSDDFWKNKDLQLLRITQKGTVEKTLMYGSQKEFKKKSMCRKRKKHLSQSLSMSDSK